MEELNETEQKEKKNGITSHLKEIFGRGEKPALTAERAWIESCYGAGTYQRIDIRIKKKQEYIADVIQGKFRASVTNPGASYSSYHCVIDIEDDIVTYSDVIFKPFVDNGFDVINLSERINEIEDTGIYLVSWKNAFKKQLNKKENENGK